MKDSLVEIETERTKLTLDLGEVTQQKMAIENQIGQLEQNVEEVRREAQLEVTEVRQRCPWLDYKVSCVLSERRWRLASCRWRLSSRKW